MKKVLFMGRKPVAARCLEYLLNTRSVEVVAVLTDSHLAVSATARIAQANSLPLLTFEQALDELNRGTLDFDLGVSMLYWRRLRGRFLTLPPLGVINFHPAPLPDYKGIGGYNLAILNALDEWGATAHYVDEQFDTGPIICVERFAIDPDRETAKSLEARTQEVLFTLFKVVIEAALESNDRLQTTPNIGGLYISRSELEAMKEIDIEADDIARKVRAFWFPPYDGAFIKLNGQRFTLVDRTILESLADPEASSLFTQRTNR